MIPYDEITKLVGIVSSKREAFNHHGAGVATLAVRLARALELPEQEVQLIEVGSHLHDIGKLLVDRDLLNKPGRLSEAERAEMQTHTTLGWSVVEEAGYDQMILDIVRNHHEHFNGSGYPDGLRYEAIPQAVRIVSVCDAYNALTNPRTYRDAFSHPFAMAMIQKDRRTIFDPELVDLFFAKVARG